MIDIEKIKAAATAATPIYTKLYRDRYFSGKYSKADLTVEQDRFIEYANPSVVLELIERMEAAERDAARYRWLRERVGVAFENRKAYPWMPCGNTKASDHVIETDNSIDAAMKETK